MKTILVASALAIAGAALAEEPAKTDAQTARPPALNLRLDDGSSAAPRITFGPSASTQTKEEREKGLPEMGGKPNQAFNRSVAPNGVNSSTPNNSVIPSAFDPAVNRQ